MPSAVPAKPLTMMGRRARIPMGHSAGVAFIGSACNASRSLSGVVSSAVTTVGSPGKHDDVMVPREDEPNLYNIPQYLSPTYRPMPLWLHFMIAITSLAIVGRRFLSQLIRLGSFRLADLTLKKIVLFLFRYAIVLSISRIAMQEGFYPPSRVTTQYLADSGSLPSVLSRYEKVTPISNSSVPIGVHSLQYKNPRNTKYAALQFHHGFGASSLSWLPILPSLTDRLGARVGVAHDAPGFGLTDRPNADTVEGLMQYRTHNSVEIGLSLLQKATTLSADGDEKQAKHVAIFGHSMGTKAALLTALACSSNKKLHFQPSLVVLVAPVLEGLTLPIRNRKTSMVEIPNKVSGVKKWLASFWIIWKKMLVDYPFQYILRRLVGTQNFWRKGLAQAWGNPQCLTDSDVLRFQWPSIGKGWERGLISFARAIQPSNDTELLKLVANLPDTTIVIVYGSKDNIVRINDNVLDALKRDFPEVNVLKIEGSGHDPFEENKETFLSELKNVLQKCTGRY